CVRAHEAVRGLGDHEVAPSAYDAHRLGLDEPGARLGIVGIEGHEAVLGLRHDLLRDDHAVAILQGRVLGRGRVGHEHGDLVARCDFPDAVDRDDFERVHATAARVSRASAAATRASRISVSVTTGRTPRASMRRASRASRVSITRTEQNSWYSRATPTLETSMPSGAINRSAGPFTGRPPMIGLTPTTRSRRATSTSRIPGTARMGPIEITGLLGHTMIVSAASSASSTPGPGRASSAPAKLTETTGGSARS